MNCNDNYVVENTPDDILIHLFDNISNRIQEIGGNKEFIIIHRVSDNKILKSRIIQKNDHHSDESFDDSSDEYENTYSNESDYDNESDKYEIQNKDEIEGMLQ